MLRRSTKVFPLKHIRLNSTLASVDSVNYAKVHSPSSNTLKNLDTFQRRHLGPNVSNVSEMLKTMKYDDLQKFVESVVPPQILTRRPLKLHDVPAQGFTESEMLQSLKKIASQNKYTVKNLIGKGYYGTHLPPVIQRNLLESPEWYTSYTPYQPEISQGRLESLLNFQTVISDMTGLPVANASLLDEGTAAGEALLLSFYQQKKKKSTYIIDSNLHEQTKSVLKTRAEPFGIKLTEVDFIGKSADEYSSILKDNDVFGCIVQYPGTNGDILPQDKLSKIGELVHANKGLFSVASDLMALALLPPPSTFGADICLGTSQRFGFPTGFGGPHAAFFSVVEKLNRKIPGRIVGVSKDRLGGKAYRLALQTREQHIKRDKATSNICTAQALSANVAAMYCVYHGPKGIKNIAQRIYGMTTLLAQQIQNFSGHKLLNKNWFDTLTIELQAGIDSDSLLQLALSKYNTNLFKINNKTVSLSLDETVEEKDLINMIELFTGLKKTSVDVAQTGLPAFPNARVEGFLQTQVFNTHHTETAMLRYMHLLQSKDLSLANSMIPLGSCTMKLNATVEMMPLTWPEFTNIHPFQPIDQIEGYRQLITSLEKDLANITGFHSISLQPTSGASGEYTGLRVIMAYLKAQGQSNRNICLIPVSAHGTNPASAAMCGMKVVPVKCLENGSLDLQDLEAKAQQHEKNLASIMITYPSTYGLFEPGVKDAVDIVHKYGGQVYLDGANMNAQVGLTSPGDLGADVCHLNLHKTFAIAHGGGGAGSGPIGVAKHLTNFLPRHDVEPIFDDLVDSEEVVQAKRENAIQAVSSVAYGNAPLLTISYAYIKMMGSLGLPYASVIAMLNANYMMNRLQAHYPIMFIGSSNEKISNGSDDSKNIANTIKHCAHEFIIDLRDFKKYGLEAIDVAKRLQDYGFHGPTLAFPVPGTLMVEPTESENKEELDRFVEAMISIKQEIQYLIDGDSRGNVLKNAPHSLQDLILSKDWETTRGYTRELAAYPLPYLKTNKCWPQVTRLDDTYGDLNLLCTCPSVEEVVQHQK